MSDTMVTTRFDDSNEKDNAIVDMKAAEKETRSKLSVKKEIDPWDVVAECDNNVKWKELSTTGKIKRLSWVGLRILLILCALYLFICSLDVLQDAFQMLSGRSASSLFSNSVLVNNPVSAMMIGVFVTVIVQSSSTSSSIVVSMVASGMLTVKQSIPIIMGTNIGTTVTNTFVALTQSGDRNVFRRAFAGATVHDAFNWLTVMVLLPIESTTHYLQLLTAFIIKDMQPVANADESPQFLKVITRPLTNLIIQIDNKVITAIAENSDRQKFPLAKYWRNEVLKFTNVNLTLDECEEMTVSVNDSVFKYDLSYKKIDENSCQLSYTEINEEKSTKAMHIFLGAGLDGYIGEVVTGVLLLVLSLLAMTLCLVLMVKILNSLFKGPMTGVIRGALNAEFPGYLKHLTGYMVMLVGAGMTVLFQSSSVFTSALTPLVGMGLITVERMYPLTMGSNIGTTVTAIMAAFTADATRIKETLQVALCHLFFNISGIILFYPLPFMRLPIPIAKKLGNTTAVYRWFAVAYLIIMFVFFPLTMFGLSLAGRVVFISIGILIVLLFALIIVVNVLQEKKAQYLPKILKSWSFLPAPLRSLEPYDHLIAKLICCKKSSDSIEDSAGNVCEERNDCENGNDCDKETDCEEGSVSSDFARKNEDPVSVDNNKSFDNKGYVNDVDVS